MFHFTPARANLLLDWNWATNAIALFVAGAWSDKLRVRKPFMLVGGLAGAAMIWLFMAHPTPNASFAGMVTVGCVMSTMIGFAYAAWMASFTETVEAHNPALTATGLAIWGWLLRLVVTFSFVALPRVVIPVTSPEKWQELVRHLRRRRPGLRRLHLHHERPMEPRQSQTRRRCP